MFYILSIMFLEQTLQKGITAHSSQSLGNVGSIAAGRFNLIGLGVKLGMIGERLVSRAISQPIHSAILVSISAMCCG